MDLKVKLLQLPVPEVERLYSNENIPLAAAYLKSWLLSENILSNEQVEIVDTDVVNFGGDLAVVNKLLKEKPEVIGFTVYMWNLERTAVVSEMIKSRNPEVKIVWGGPEVQEDIGDYPCCDVFFVGEGEYIFADFIADCKEGKGHKRFYKSSEPVDLQKLNNPYSEGILVPEKGGAMLVETMRGCIYPCKYCFYSKSFKGLRYFPEEQLEEIFRIANDSGVSEIYLMDPSFNCSKDLKGRLENISRLNSRSINIHTEIRLEAVNGELADGLARAGVKSVEVGLQSVNDDVLKRVGRSWNMDKFILGGKLLKEKGIDIKTGVIMGLPGENMDGFMRTLDFVMEQELEESMEIYPLSLIPGTVLRDLAEEMGVTYMDVAPYWVLDSGGMDEREIRYLIEMVEHKLDIEFHTPVIPFFENFREDYLYHLDLRRSEEVPDPEEYFSRLPALGNSLTVVVDEKFTYECFAKLGRYLGENYPSALVQIILDYTDPSDETHCEKILSAFNIKSDYFDSIHYFKHCAQRSHSVRLFWLGEDPEVLEDELYCDPVIRYREGMLEEYSEELEAYPLMIVPYSIDDQEKSDLKEFYSGFERFLFFEKLSVVD